MAELEGVRHWGEWSCVWGAGVIFGVTANSVPLARRVGCSHSGEMSHGDVGKILYDDTGRWRIRRISQMPNIDAPTNRTPARIICAFWSTRTPPPSKANTMVCGR